MAKPTYHKVTSMPPMGTQIRVTSDGKQYTGKVFCNPYQWRPGETHFSVQVECEAVPVFVVERCVIEVEGEEEVERQSEEKEAVNKFVSALLENMQDLDPQFSKLVDEHFWELA